MAKSIREVMTQDAKTMKADETLTSAAQAMKESDIGCVLVMTGGKLHGLVTDRDIVVRAIAENRDPSRTKLEEICTKETRTLSPDASVDDAVELMRKESIRRVPVVENDSPVGMVSLGDLAVERDPKSALGQISAAPPQS